MPRSFRIKSSTAPGSPPPDGTTPGSGAPGVVPCIEMRLFSRPGRVLYSVAASLVCAACAVCYLPLIRQGPGTNCLFWLVPLYLLCHIMSLLLYTGLPRWRLRITAHGATLLLVFLGSAVPAVLYHLGRLPLLWNGRWRDWLWSALIAIAVEALIFWNGIICLYLTSTQLGIRWRIIGALCGMIPVVHLAVLGCMLAVVIREVNTEAAFVARDRARATQAICRTKYPILMVHGVFFRDFRYFNYWGRIPDALQANGATVYYGNQQSAASVADCGKELADRIRQLVHDTGCGKINIIAHSKGGLDSRAAIAMYDVSDLVASVTTINTPHRGCGFADYLLSRIPEHVQISIAHTYNDALARLGDKSPDFLAAVSDLTAARCAEMASSLAFPDESDIFCQSFGSKLDRPTGGRFPLNFSYPLVRFFDGPNDGLVAESSFAFGESCTLLRARGRRGISHGDMIDLNRENIPGFDVREFYVSLVADLKERGL